MIRGDATTGGLTGDMGKADIIRDLRRQSSSLLANKDMMSPQMWAINERMAADIDAKIARIEAGGNRGTVGGFRGRNRAGAGGYADADAAEKAREAAEKAMKASADAAEDAEKERLRIGRLYADQYVDMREDMQDDVNSILEDGADIAALMNRNAMDQIEAIHDEARNAHAEMTEFALQAARNMQDAFAQFLFDPFADGLKGMLKGFIDTIRRMVAEMAAAKIFDSLGGVAGISGGLGKLFGFATGGSFKVGGSGGTDSSLVAFKATPGEMVDVRTPGQARGGGGIVQHISIDARGSSIESVKLLQATIPAIIRQAIDGARMAVRDDRSRGYA
jgi:hypothetical protein